MLRRVLLEKQSLLSSSQLLFQNSSLRFSSSSSSSPPPDLGDLLEQEVSSPSPQKLPPKKIISPLLSPQRPKLGSLPLRAGASATTAGRRLQPIAPLSQKSSSKPAAAVASVTAASSSGGSSTADASSPAITDPALAAISIVEYVKLLIPHGTEYDTGMLVSDIFGALSSEQRSAVRKHSKMLSRFLLQYPQHVAISPGGSVVVVVETGDGNLNVRDGAEGSSDVAAGKLDKAQLAARQAAEQRCFMAEKLLKPVMSNHLQTTELEAQQKKKKKKLEAEQQQQHQLLSAEELAAQFVIEQARDQAEFARLERLARADFLQHYTPVSAVQELRDAERKAQDAARAVAVGGSGPCHYDGRIELERIPPPDLFSSLSEAQDGSVRAPLEKRRTEALFETSLSTQTLVKFVPPWFVPCSEVVGIMGGGYTEEHFEQFFSDSAAVEVINLNGARFVRVHGGLKNKSMVEFEVEEAEQAEELFAALKPDPSLIPEILPFCPPRGEWVSLFDVVSRLPESLQQRLPFQGPLSLLYFAQMQHIFSFTPNNGGGISVPVEMPMHLHWDSTPSNFVRAMHYIFNALLGAKAVFVGGLLDFGMPALHDDGTPAAARRNRRREELIRGLMLARAVHGPGSAASPLAKENFPPQFAYECDVEKDVLAVPERVEDLMRVYVALHRSMFAYQGENSGLADGFGGNSGLDGFSTPDSQQQQHQQQDLRTVMLRFEFEAEERHTLDIPTQIEIAKRRNNGKQLRKLRRRLAALTQPDNPLLDEENLAKSIAEFLPPDRSVSWMRVKKNLPMELLDLMPPNIGKFLSKFPQHFKKYDVGIITNHHVHLQVPHLPPPAGSFRQPSEYTEEELLSAVGQVLVRGPKTVASLASFLPNTIGDAIRLKFGGVAQLVQNNPQYFALVIKDVKNKDLRTAVVTLLQVPNLITVEHDLVEAEKIAERTREDIRSMNSGDAGRMDATLNEDGSPRAPEDVWGSVIEEQTGIKSNPGERAGGRGGGERSAEDDDWVKAAIGDDTNFAAAGAAAEPKSSEKKLSSAFDDEPLPSSARSSSGAASSPSSSSDLWTDGL